MPTSRQYSAGSVIYFEKEKSDKVFILKEGRVILRYISIEENFSEKTETINPGQFFGVKSAIANFPREETATAISNCVILILTVPEFEQLAAKNIDVLMKMLRVFSNQLRNVHKHVRRYLTDEISEQRDIELMKIGDFYLKNKRFDHAVYVYSRYLELYPDSENSGEVRDKLMNAQKGMTMGLSNPNQTVAEIKKANAESSGGNDITKTYYEAVSLFSQNKFNESVQLLSSTLKSAQSADNKEFIEKCHFQLGKCYLKMGDFANSKDKFSFFMKNFPTSTMLKEAVFNLAAAHEGSGEKDQAKSLYSRVMTMGNEDQLSAKAKIKFDELERA